MQRPTRLGYRLDAADSFPGRLLARRRRRTGLVAGVVSLVLLTAACEQRSITGASQPELSRGAAVADPSDSRSGARLREAREPARRVIRAADLSLETDAPDQAGREARAIAESKGGFVLSSDTTRSRTANGDEDVTVTVIFRVPVTTFDSTLESVRALGKHVFNEKVTGQDVTEEFVDNEARLKAQRAVEEQYLAILRDAKTTHDILEVKEKLGDVRTEIERAEGRRRYLESQTELATFTVRFAHRIEAIEASGPGFGTSVTKAADDFVQVSIDIVNGFDTGHWCSPSRRDPPRRARLAPRAVASSTPAAVGDTGEAREGPRSAPLVDLRDLVGPRRSLVRGVGR